MIVKLGEVYNYDEFKAVKGDNGIYYTTNEKMEPLHMISKKAVCNQYVSEKDYEALTDAEALEIAKDWVRNCNDIL